jgi:hypothetical protein
MITASEMIFRLDSVSLGVYDGFESVVSKTVGSSDPLVVSGSIKEIIVSSSDKIYEYLLKTYPSLPINSTRFKRMIRDGVRGLDPRVIYKETLEASRKYGWQLGTIFAIKNILTTFVLPPLFLALGLKGVAAFIAFFPSNIIFVPMLVKYFNSKSSPR